MIKFFRKIRQDLISEGKTGKYMKYGIGEIILVVIGILIALGINNWNERRKNQILERDYIQELKTDLIKDSTIISEMLSQSNKQLRAKYLLHKYLIEQTDFVLFDNNLEHYPDFLETNEYHVDSLSSYFLIQWTSKSRYLFNPITTTIDEMKSTGKIGIIQNQEIRRSIIETYNSYETYKSNYQNNYQRQMEEILKLIFDIKPELYTMDNSNIIEMFNDQRVRNRFEGNFVISQNRKIKELRQVNQNLLNELNGYTEKE
jgi:hypothetical protein